ncbi:MAG: hypothetical protein ABS35_16800 [Kaistia sp. SCN 65-12]|nr:MAG: hypothetical protein ABS35_16800 [Kaistia sp. SCN 65-12]
MVVNIARRPHAAAAFSFSLAGGGAFALVSSFHVLGHDAEGTPLSVMGAEDRPSLRSHGCVLAAADIPPRYLIGEIFCRVLEGAIVPFFSGVAPEFPLIR